MLATDMLNAVLEHIADTSAPIHLLHMNWEQILMVCKLPESKVMFAEVRLHKNWEYTKLKPYYHITESDKGMAADKFAYYINDLKLMFGAAINLMKPKEVAPCERV